MRKFNFHTLFSAFAPRRRDDAADISMPKDVEKRAKARLLALVDASETQTTPAPRRAPSFLRGLARAPIGVLIAVLIVGSGTATAARADHSVPGDNLFFLDRIFEELRLILARSPEARIHLQIQFAQERLEELESLTDEAGDEATNGNDEGDNDDGDDTTSTDDTGDTTSTDDTGDNGQQDDTGDADSQDDENGDADTNEEADTDEGDADTEALLESLDEVQKVMLKIQENAVDLRMKTNGTVTDEQLAAFLDQVEQLTAEQDRVVKKLDLKIQNRQLKFRIQLFNETAAEHAASKGLEGFEGGDDEDGDAEDDEEENGDENDDDEGEEDDEEDENEEDDDEEDDE